MTQPRSARRRVQICCVGLAAIAIAACSPNTSASPSAAPSTSAAASTLAQSVAPGGVTSSDRWCLNTTDEASAALGEKVTGMTGAEVPGLGGGCAYSGQGGSPVLSESIINGPAALGTFGGARIAQGAVAVSGVGDEAVLVTERGPLVVRVGRVVVSMTIAPTTTLSDTNKLRMAFEQLGKAAVQRIPPE